MSTRFWLAPRGRASPEEAWKELITSRQRIEQEMGGLCWTFIYPNGEVMDTSAA